MAASDFDKYLPAPPSVAKRPDTLAIFKKLRDAGVPLQQAEAEVEVISEVADGVEGELRKAFAPKSVMREAAVCEDSTDPGVRFAQMEARLENRIAQIEVDMAQAEARRAQAEARRARLGAMIVSVTVMVVGMVFNIIVNVLY